MGGLGNLRALVIGVEGYDPDSGWQPLRNAANDAKAVADTLCDVRALGASAGAVRLLTSKTERSPSRGELMRAVRALSAQATSDERLLLYFRGHAQTLGNRAYLVPEDAYAIDDPAALLALEEVMASLSESSAAAILLVLDVTEPLVLKKAKGLSSLVWSDDPKCSPNPTLGAFAFHLVRAMNGDPACLNADRALTMKSLQAFLTHALGAAPALVGDFVWGDFNRSVIVLPGIGDEESPVSGFEFSDRTPVTLRNIMPEFRLQHFTTKRYLDERVSVALGQRYEKEQGERAAAIRNRMGFAVNEVVVEENLIRFPSGRFRLEYQADGEDLRRGSVIQRLQLREAWVKQPGRIPDALQAMELRPTEFRLFLTKVISPSASVSALESRGWRATSILAESIRFERKDYALTLEKDAIELSGIDPRELFGPSAKPETVQAVSVVLQQLFEPGGG